MSTCKIKVELCSFWGGDRDTANAAWASSYDIEKALAKTDQDVARVVTTLVVQDHTTPLERIWLDFFITLPIDSERRFDKTRMSTQFQDFIVDYQLGEFGRQGMSQSELSGRYRTIPDRFLALPEDVAKIMAKVEVEKPEYYQEVWREHFQEQHDMYQEALTELKEAQKNNLITNIEYKRAREVFRRSLGTGFMTDMRIVLNMHAFETLLNKRLAPDAQLEDRVIAHQILLAVLNAKVAPVLVEELIKKNNWLELIKDIPTPEAL